MKNFLKISSIILWFLLVITPAWAQEAVYPEKPRGYVNDFADIIDNDGQLEAKLDNYEKQTGNEISVVTVLSIGDVSAEEYAVTLFSKWKIGKQDKDNGILLLVALEEKVVRIEVGYGLEGAVPDSVAGSIIRNEITPGFGEGNYSKGIEKGVDAIIASIGGEYSAEAEKAAETGGGIIFLIILATVIIFIIIIARSSKKDGGSGAGHRSSSGSVRRSSSNFNSFGSGGGLSSGGRSSGGSSFGGFGGGRSGGGGASGRW